MSMVTFWYDATLTSRAAYLWIQGKRELKRRSRTQKKKQEVQNCGGCR